MKNTHIPLVKQSKKAQRDYNNSRRNVWSVKPITKVVPNKKRSYIPKGDDYE